MGLTASQIRQDFNCFGEFGQQGYGYNVTALKMEIGRILGFNKLSPLILLGAGNLGRAIAAHIDFKSKGFELVGIFDKNPAFFGEKIGDVEISDLREMEKFCDEYKPQCAVLCIPKEAASKEVERLIAKGVRAFWNFTHYDLRIEHSDISVENVHLGDSLATLSYRLNSDDGTC